MFRKKDNGFSICILSCLSWIQYFVLVLRSESSILSCDEIMWQRYMIGCAGTRMVSTLEGGSRVARWGSWCWCFRSWGISSSSIARAWFQPDPSACYLTVQFPGAIPPRLGPVYRSWPRWSGWARWIQSAAANKGVEWRETERYCIAKTTEIPRRREERSRMKRARAACDSITWASSNNYFSFNWRSSSWGYWAWCLTRRTLFFFSTQNTLAWILRQKQPTKTSETSGKTLCSFMS